MTYASFYLVKVGLETNQFGAQGKALRELFAQIRFIRSTRLIRVLSF